MQSDEELMHFERRNMEINRILCRARFCVVELEYLCVYCFLDAVVKLSSTINPVTILLLCFFVTFCIYSLISLLLPPHVCVKISAFILNKII